MRILIVLSSHGELGDSGEETGLWFEELASPYYIFAEAGHDVVLVSPKGGKPPIDPMSIKPPFDTVATHRFDADERALASLASTGLLENADATSFDAVFYPGGHGPLFDLAEDSSSIALIENFYAAGKPVVTVCHGAIALIRVRDTDGQPIVSGKRVTGFANEEERAVGRVEVSPFLVEDELIRLGSHYEKVDEWLPYVVIDGHLITGQNPASAEVAARALLQQLSGAGAVSTSGQQTTQRA